ncbi:MAG: 4-carboxymuconolactone decarboxylase [Achromobacter sp.]|uniref:carboxymuconolactone decarboxylase family protein n=1 Tax=Achromobacter sp. TaxID=134375 RepID=UPI0012C5B4AE|nr:carboxymuconolactone decarboxylase family protein [Achromobacter sp.]MPS79699.1 4-carboxymuconolactone decarboxylase [Achromobacter sp.]
MTTQKDLLEAGLDVRRDMFGVAGAEQALETATDFTAPMQDIVTRWCFGEVWNRSPLDRKTRSMLTLAIITTLGKQNQFKLHVRGAIANGVSKEEIREVLLHTMVYAGVPAAVDSFGSAVEILKDLGLEK